MIGFKKMATVVLLAGLGFTGTSQASLFDRGNGLIYDDVIDVTWTVNANINDFMTWTQANSWADNLVLGGYSDWRLPTTISATVGNQYTHELAELFFNEFGGGQGTSITTNANYKLFTTPI